VLHFRVHHKKLPQKTNENIEHKKRYEGNPKIIKFNKNQMNKTVINKNNIHQFS